MRDDFAAQASLPNSRLEPLTPEEGSSEERQEETASWAVSPSGWPVSLLKFCVYSRGQQVKGAAHPRANVHPAQPAGPAAQRVRVLALDS